jgi:hypothetical protein
MIRRLLIKFLCGLLKVEVKPDGTIVDLPKEILFVSPDFTKDKYEASDSIDEFLTKIKDNQNVI